MSTTSTPTNTNLSQNPGASATGLTGAAARSVTMLASRIIQLEALKIRSRLLWIEERVRVLLARGDVPGLPIVATTLPPGDQIIDNGQQAVVYGPLTINDGSFLYVNGTGQLILLRMPYGT